MKEFLTNYYSILTKSFELLAALTGVLLYNKYKNTSVKYFIWFLVWIVINEIIGSYPKYLESANLFHLIEGTLIEENYWWFTIFWTSAATLFYSWFLGNRYKSVLFRRILYYLRCLYILVVLSTIIFKFEEFFKGRAAYIDILSLSIILFSAIFYLYELLSSEKLLNFYKSVYFYVAAIIFIWWLVTTPLGFFEVYNTKQDWNYVVTKWTIKLAANILMYLGFTIALIVSKPENE